MTSALIMGVAICGTHYSGMAAGSYTYVKNQSNKNPFLLNGKTASITASLSALLVCYWITTVAIVVPLRRDALSTRLVKGSDATHYGNTNLQQSEATSVKWRNDISPEHYQNTWKTNISVAGE